jgi:hypothetical protein
VTRLTFGGTLDHKRSCMSVIPSRKCHIRFFIVITFTVPRSYTLISLLWIGLVFNSLSINRRVTHLCSKVDIRSHIYWWYFGHNICYVKFAFPIWYYIRSTHQVLANRLIYDISAYTIYRRKSHWSQTFGLSYIVPIRYYLPMHIKNILLCQADCDIVV